MTMASTALSRKWLRNVVLTVKFFAAYHLFLDYGAEIHATFGPSMLPTLNTAGDWCLVNKWHYRYGRNMKVGDLVVVSKPGSPDIFVLKRIIGMPGDVVLLDPSVSKGEFVKVPQGHIWITGDNLPHSTDSRHYGPVAMGLIRGKAIATVYPKWRTLDDGLAPLHPSPIARGFAA